MSREFDFVIFGGTGFTGKFVCAEVRKIAQEKELKWAIAGRSLEKVKRTLEWMVNTGKLTASEREDVGIVVANVDDDQSLFQMCKKAKVVLDCVGPYRFYGEAVVKACLGGECDYVDVSGEPEYLERIEYKYHDEAVQKGVYIVGCCGFDSIPSDLGVVYAKKMFPGTLSSVENYFTQKFGPLGMTGNYGTYATLVHSTRNINSLRELRRSFRKKPVPICGPKLKSKGIHYKESQRRYGLPFPGADVAVVRRSQRHFFEKCNQIPVQYAMYFALKLKAVIALLLFGVILKLFTLTLWGTNLLLNYPKFFTAGGFCFEGPTEEQMAGAGFNFMMYCKGYKRDLDIKKLDTEKEAPDKEIVVKISGPEIGYVLTPITMVQSALCMINERSKLPSTGGVYAPGCAFGETDIIENIGKRGVKFEVVSK